MKSQINEFLSNGSKKFQVWIVTILLSFISSCTSDPTDPLIVTTDTATTITDTQAKLGGVVISDGGHAVTDRGVCISSEANPTINDPTDKIFTMGSGSGAFSNTATGLAPSTAFHSRAYATNSTGTVYGEDKVFTTLAASMTTALVVTTNAPTEIASTQAVLGGNVTNDGGSTVVDRGVCTSLEANPTINDPTDKKFAMGTGIGLFSSSVTDLSPNTLIHVRAYATNSTGTVYGEDKIFTTLVSVGCPVVNITASITTPTTWVIGKVYMLTGPVSVSSVLTIEPGAVIKLNGGSLDIAPNGKIVANGTATNHIVFTSYADDSVCGDSNGDGTATTAKKGDWQLLFLNGGTNTFNYCDFLYGGKNRNGRNCVVEVSVSGPSFTFDHCTFAHTLSSSSSAAYAFYAQSYMNDHTVSIFTNNAFFDNDRPIFLDVNYTLNPNNIFHSPVNSTIANARNGIYFLGGNIPAGRTVGWNVTEVPYVLNTSCRAFIGSTLNIGPNVVVKFVSSDSELGSTNTVNLNATAFLTSYKDDLHGGDTNGDGSASSPAISDWYGYWNNPTGFAVWIAGPNILYASPH